ncbi:MAG: autotransporter domain-containing protein [Opitutaceae bacterium]|jgi:autotransporter-associated beta strand protein|nr:autotransporter domain-containing protein [Opitutaceae bacterium]
MHTTPSRAYSRRAALALLAALVLTPASAQTRDDDDNRRLFWNGAGGGVWDDSAASWQTSGSYLGALTSGSATWVTSDDDPPAPPALAATVFLAGDAVVFDSLADAGAPDSRTIAVAAGGVTVSDIVVSGAGDYTFTGGAITADGTSVLVGSPQLSGDGITPAGRLVKLGAGALTLSNTAPNHFAGGIVLAQGALVIADARALGANRIDVTPAGTGTTGSYMLPAVVADSNGLLLRAATTMLGSATIAVTAGAAGLDITGDIHLLANTPLTLAIEGDTTVSGRLYRVDTIATGGYIIKTGDGDLTLTGERNWFYGTSTVAAGRLIVRHPSAIGSGNMAVTGGTLVFQNVSGTMPMAFTGGGRVEITDSDLTLNWRNSRVLNAPATADSDIGRLAVTRSRLFALASGTLSTVLGGAGAEVTISDRSTLILGREGVTPGPGMLPGQPGLLSPVNYAVTARNLAIDATSALVFNPNTSLVIGGTLAFASGASLTFGGAGVSRLEYSALDAAGASPDDIAAAPAGSTLATTAVTIGNRQRRDYVVVNQGANPMQDSALMLGAIDAVVDTVTGRLGEAFLAPLNPITERQRRRGWTNSAWARYFGGESEYSSESPSNPGYSGRHAGLLAGLDGTCRQRVLIGFYGGLAENNLTTTNATSLLSKQRILGIHATPRFKRLHLTAHLFTGRAASESFRHEFSGVTHGRWDAAFNGGSIELGASFQPWRDGFLRPSAGLRYTRINISGLDERGPGALLVDDFSDELARATLGLEAGQKFRLFKRAAIAGLSLGLKRAVRSPRASLDAAFADAPEVAVSLERGDYYPDTVALGLSLRAAITADISAGIAADYETGSGHSRWTAALSLNCTW